jgi:hypothetical protein
MSKLTPEQRLKRKQDRLDLLAKHKQELKDLKVQLKQERLEHNNQLKEEERWLAFQEALGDFQGQYKPVPENSNYIATDDGRVYNYKHCRWCNHMKHKLGYVFIGKFTINGKYKMALLHQVIAHTFIPKPNDKTELNHLDGNKKNNASNNLVWVTHKQNMSHAWETGLMENLRKCNGKKICKGNAKLTQEQADEIRKQRANGVKVKDLCEQYNISYTPIYRLLKGETWNH